MTVNEYSICAHGYFMRSDRSKEGLRILYQLIWNVAPTPKSDKIRSVEMMKKKWPLLTDSGMMNPTDTKEEMELRWKEALALNKRMKEKANGNNYAEHRN